MFIPSLMHGWTPRRGLAHRVGIGVSVVVAALAVGIMLWRGGSSSAKGPAHSEIPAAPDIRQVPSADGGLRQMGGGSRMNITMMDRADPSRIAGEMQADRSVPLENRRFRLERPRVWVFLRDGRTIHVEAERGEAMIPDGAGARPEDGVVEGDVVMRMFAPLPRSERPDPRTTPPVMKLTTQQLRFDGRAGEINFPESVEITGERVEFSGAGVLIVLNEGAERLELLRVERTRSLLLKPEPPSTKTTAALPGATPAGVPDETPKAPVGEPVPVKVPVETMYALWCERAVSATQGSRTLTGDRLEGWVRLLDNSVPSLALRNTASESRRGAAALTPPIDASMPRIAVVTTVQPPAVPAQPFHFAKSDEPLLLKWDGPMEVRPLSHIPPELNGNDAFVRCTSTPPRIVTILDADSGVIGKGTMVEYAATRREAAIAGGSGVPAVIERTGTGRAMGERFDVSLGTGRVQARGSGEVRSVSEATGTDGEETSRVIAWSKEAEFQFGLNDDTIGSRLEKAVLQGSVTAGDGKGFLRGESVTALFKAIDADRSFMERLSVLGSARAGDGKDGSLAAESLEVSFVRRGDTDGSDPIMLTARGGVRGERLGSVLSADALEAKLDQDEQGDSFVASAEAIGAVSFIDNEGVEAYADQLSANPAEQVVELRGENARAGQRGSMVRGQFIRLDGAKKSLLVPGPGEFEHIPPPAEGEQPTTARITWTRGMTFDDSVGTVVCDGDAAGELRQGHLARDSIRAESIRVQLAPAEREPGRDGAHHPVTAPIRERGAGQADPLNAANKRKLLSVVAIGKDPATPAVVEVRRYDPATSGGEAVLSRLMYLEGGEIRADNQSGTLDVPGAGKLLTLDKRTDRAATPGEQPVNGGIALDESSARGSALFTWKEAFSLNRNAGTVSIRGGTRLVHAATEGGAALEVEAAEMNAQVSESVAGGSGGEPGGTTAGKGGLDEPFNGTLRTAAATGGVWMRYQQKEVSADIMTYDAATRTVDAQGTNGNLITAFDPESATPITATRVVWNLNENKFQLMGIQQPVVVPK